MSTRRGSGGSRRGSGQTRTGSVVSASGSRDGGARADAEAEVWLFEYNDSSGVGRRRVERMGREYGDMVTGKMNMLSLNAIGAGTVVCMEVGARNPAGSAPA